jgi:hypothetical protein
MAISGYKDIEGKNFDVVQYIGTMLGYQAKLYEQVKGV